MSPEERVDLSEAISILEITDLDSLTEADLPKLRRKAQVRWHPDKILYTKPSEETLQRYQRNFRLIGPAIEAVEGYLKGQVHADTYDDAYEQKRAQTYEPPQETIRRNAGRMQDELRNAWDGIRANSYKMHEEEVVVAPGLRFADMLRADLADKVPLSCMLSFVTCAFLGIFALIIALLASQAMKINPNFLTSLVGLVLLVQFAGCALAFLPMSRFWLPDALSDFAVKMVNIGLWIRGYIAKKNWHEHSWIGIPLGLMSWVALALYWVIIFPLYLLAGALLGDRGFKDVTSKVRYYAGAADWYVDDLMQKDPAEMTDDELFDLSYCWRELSDAPKAAY